MSTHTRSRVPSRPIGRLLVLASLAASLVGCASPSANYNNQRTFSDPKGAAVALASAAKAGDATDLESILGSDARDVLSSGDPVADSHQRQVFAVAFDEGWSLERVDGSTRELVIGHEQWPFPIPIVHDSRGWWFDTAAGKVEVLARRIGRNELAAIGTLRTYAIAQKEYASVGHDGRPAGCFAQKLRSDPGTQNGLYWPTAAGEKPSPLGQFVAQAASEGYPAQDSASSQPTALVPYHGYYFRSLAAQGPGAPGGRMSYVDNGAMTRGFAMVAWPADYGNSGIMSFLVGSDGIIYETDLGEGTAASASGITEYDPDGRWSKVE